jgi:hypothetical protein
LHAFTPKKGEYWVSPKPDGTRYMLAMLQLHTQCNLPLSEEEKRAEEEKNKKNEEDEKKSGSGSSMEDVQTDTQFIESLLENKPQLDAIHPLVCFMDRARARKRYSFLRGATLH